MSLEINLHGHIGDEAAQLLSSLSRFDKKARGQLRSFFHQKEQRRKVKQLQSLLKQMQEEQAQAFIIAIFEKAHSHEHFEILQQLTEQQPEQFCFGLAYDTTSVALTPPATPEEYESIAQELHQLFDKQYDQTYSALLDRFESSQYDQFYDAACLQNRRSALLINLLAAYHSGNWGLIGTLEQQYRDLFDSPELSASEIRQAVSAQMGNEEQQDWHQRQQQLTENDRRTAAREQSQEFLGQASAVIAELAVLGALKRKEHHSPELYVFYDLHTVGRRAQSLARPAALEPVASWHRQHVMTQLRRARPSFALSPGRFQEREQSLLLFPRRPAGEQTTDERCKRERALFEDKKTKTVLHTPYPVEPQAY